jgi:hypothetical protein
MSLWLLTALALAAGPPGVTIDAWLEQTPAPRLNVQVRAPKGVAWTLEEPVVAPLQLGSREERVEDVGGGLVTTRSWALAGQGSSIVERVCVSTPGADAVCAPTLYVDLGAPRERPEMADITAPNALWPVRPTTAVAALATLVAFVLAARAALSRLRRAPRTAPVVPPEAPWTAAIRRWEAVRGDATLTDEQKALALSEIFRAYAESVLEFPARAWTTTETLTHLESLEHLPKENIPRARRVLRATDRVKYAEARPGTDFFEELDADLRTFIDATRPRAWEAP